MYKSEDQTIGTAANQIIWRKTDFSDIRMTGRGALITAIATAFLLKTAQMTEEIAAIAYNGHL